MASHEIDEVERLADWIGLLNKGHLGLCESVVSLQARFRQVEVRINEEVSWPSPLPASWLLAEKAAQDCSLSRRSTTQARPSKRCSAVPDFATILTTPMSLKSIFLALARTYRLAA